MKDNYARNRGAKCTDVFELEALTGLLYLAGAYNVNRKSLEELWGTKGDGEKRFGLVISIKKFKFVLLCM